MKRIFTKLMAALALLVFMTPSMVGWGQSTYTKVTTAPSDWTGTYVIVADASYVIFTGQSGSNNYGGYAAVTISSGSVTGNYSDYEVLVEKSGDYYTMKHVSSGKYLGWNTGNNLHFSTDEPTTNAFKWNLSTSSILNANDNARKLQYNSGSPRFACYTSSQKVAYLYLKESVSPTTVATTTTIDATGITNIDVYTSTAAGTLTATVTETENGNAVSGATVTWTSSKENVATIDENGVVTLVGAGTTTITASYEGVSGEFGASSATYDLTVTSSAPYVQPTEFEIGLNNALFGTDYNGSVSGITDANPIVGTQDNVTVTYAGSGNHYVNDNQIRFYPNNKLTFEAPSGYEIKEIVFTSAGTWAATISADEGTYNSSTKTWTGSATSVLFTGSGSSRCDMSKATITIGALSTDPTIEADNVNIAYDATGGEIAYTITNPVTGKTLQATADAGWVSNIEVGTEAITFTTTANEANTERVATFTLTYEGAEDKTVTVTQAAAPVIYNTIPALFAAATSTATEVNVTFNNWVVSGVSTNGKNVFVTDNAGNGFVIYDSNAGLGSTYAVGKTLSGTITCSLKKNQGYAQLTGVAGLTISDGGTVSTTNIAMASLAGVNTGALVSYNNLTCSVSNDKYYLTDGTTTLQVYNALYAFNELEAGKTYNITGVYQQYGDIKEILPRNTNDIVEVTPTTPTIAVADATVNATAAGIDDGTLNITYSNLTINDYDDFAIQFYDENDNELNGNDEPKWLEVLTASDNVGGETVYLVSYSVNANTGSTRTAYFKVWALDGATPVYSNKVTVTQAAYVPTPTNDDYVRISSLDQLVDGSIVIIAARHNSTVNSYYAMGQTLTSGKFNGVQFTSTTSHGSEILPSAIVTNQNDYYWVVNVTSNGYTFTKANADKIGYGSSTNFVMNGNNTEWTIESNTSDESAMVGEYTGFVTKNKNTDTRAFAFNGSAFGAYSTGNNNMSSSSYNFYLDFFVQMPTYSLSINGYADVNVKNGYHLIASPATVVPTAANGFLTSAYDLYYFDQSQVGAEWRNYKANNFNLVSGKGYLYASSTSTELTFTGQPYNGNGDVVLDSVPGKQFAGWNLIGNPICTSDSVTLNKAFFRMNSDGDGFVARVAGSKVGKMEGVFVKGQAGQTVTFAQVRRDEEQSVASISLNVIGTTGQVKDNAIVRFDNGETLEKFYFGSPSANIYVSQNGKDYAIVRAEAQGEMPVNFKASKNGTYTITITADNVEFSYLHLIDNKTGANIDLLSTPSYTFNAKTTDYASRFRLVFSANNGTNEDANETFAYNNGSEWVIGNQGEATLQVIDMMGRILSSQTINGNATINLDETCCVYVLRLVNGENVKVQKIVVR